VYFRRQGGISAYVSIYAQSCSPVVTGGEARLRYCFYFGRGERGPTVAYRSCRTSREKSSSESTFYVRRSELSLMVRVCVDLSRQCSAIRIREFVMQIVSVCTYYYLLLFLLILIIRYSSGQLCTDLEVTRHAFPRPT
jgi:hypothetical protein